MKIIILSLLIFTYASAYPTYAGSCDVPQHGVDGTAGDGPYILTANTTEYHVGEAITINIGGGGFKGLLLTVLTADGTKLTGLQSPPTGYNYKTCTSTDDSIQHDSDATRSDVDFGLIVPNVPDLGSMTIRAIVVTNYNTWYALSVCLNHVDDTGVCTTAGLSLGSDDVHLDLIDAGVVFVCLLLGFSILSLITSNMHNKFTDCLKTRIGTSPSNDSILRSKLVSTVTFNAIPDFLDLTWGKALLFLVWVMGVIGVYELSMGEYDDDPGGKSKTFGVLTVFNCILTALLANRSLRLWYYLFGVSFEHSLVFHRVLGFVTLIFASVHALEELGNSSLEDALSDYDGHVKQGWGVWAWFCLIGATVFAVPAVRRWSYKLFYFSHILVLPFMLFAAYHSEINLYIFVAIAMHVLDMLYREYQISRNYTIEAKCIGDSSTLIRVSHPSQQVLPAYPGDYWFLRAKCGIVAHPITRCRSEDNGTCILFHIKAGAKGTWSRSIYDQVNAGEELEFGIEGPYGTLEQSPTQFDQLVLVAGGIGVTPMLSILQHIVSHGRSSQKVRFIWAVRDISIIRPHVPFLNDSLKELDVNLVISIHITNTIAVNPQEEVLSMFDSGSGELGDAKGTDPHSMDGEVSIGRVSIHLIRPNFNDIFSKLSSTSTAVFSCGPEPMIVASQRAASLNNYAFHKETFHY